MVYLDTNYWKNGVILKFRVFTENFQLILKIKREKISDGVIFINLIKFIELYFDGNPMGWDRHKLLWDGMGWDRKICPMDKPVYNCLNRPRINVVFSRLSVS